MSTFCKVGFAVFLAASSVGCVSKIKIDNSYAYKAGNVDLIDNRNEESKKGKRESIFSAVAFIPEKSIEPRPLDKFASELAYRLEPIKKIKLEVEDFLVMDYFPTRMAPITDGWVGRTFVKPVLDADKHYIDRLNLSPKTNSVVCIFSGKIDDREVLSAYSSPYKMSPLAVMVRNDPNFHKAVAECISGLTVETKARWQS